MRTAIFLRNVLLLVTIATPALVRAQFQQPTNEELKMTVDPKAPGAAAVYLYREETTDDSLHYHSYYERIKVLTEKGKELATIRIPYERGQFKVTDIKGRTIHADGTIVPLTTKADDLMEVKTKAVQVNQMVFTLPSVEVGSILEYRLQIRYGDDLVSSPTWNVQQPYFVHKAHYFFNPESTAGRDIISSRGENLDRLMTSTRLDHGITVARDNRGRFSVDLTDIEPIPSEDWMPPLNTLKERVEFYYTYARTGADFWNTEGKRWAKEAERFTKPSGTLKSEVAQIVAPGDTEEQKARKIYAAVMKLENTRFTRTKSEAERKAEKLKVIKDAEDVWKRQSGTDDEITLLFVALARAADLKVWPMQIVDRSRAFFDTTYLGTSQLDDYVAVVEVGGKEVYLDPGQKVCPFGILHWKHSLASGLRLSDKGAVMATTPAGTYKTAVTQRFADLTIDRDGSVTGVVRFVMAGPEAIRWRQLVLENDVDEAQKQFKESIRNDVPDGVQVDFDHFIGLDDYEVNLIAAVKISGNIGTATGKHFFLPSQFFESRAKHPFVAQEKRTSPVDVHYAKIVLDDVTYHLPPGFAVENPLPPANASWPNNAILKTGFGATGNAVRIMRNLAYNFVVLDPKSYPDLHDFYQKVATADQQQLVLIRTPVVVKGN